MRMNTSAQASSGPQILAIDDEVEILNILEMVLMAAGDRVLTAPGAVAGLEIYERQWPEIDLVLLDYLMPEMTGDLVFEHLQRINPQVRVLLLTACESAVAQRLMAQGLRGYIPKPFYLDDLVSRIREQLLT